MNINSMKLQKIVFVNFGECFLSKYSFLIRSTNYLRCLFFCFTGLLVVSCSNIQPNSKGKVEEEKVNLMPSPPLLKTNHFGTRQEIIPVEQIFQLSDEQREKFLEFFNHSRNQDELAHRRIYQYLESKLGGFTYNAQTTTATEALARNYGNCLSLAILTTTLASIVDVDIDFQLVETRPVYQKSNDVIVSSQHIRTVLYSPAQKGLIFRGRIYIDYFNDYGSNLLRAVEEDEFQSMYYTNLAAESLMKNQLNQTYWFLIEALKLKANHSHAINMMGLLYAREGFSEAAEKMFKYGIEHSESNLDILNNYHSLLVNLNRVDGAKKIKEKIGRRDDKNPYKWISIANSSYNLREYSKAIVYYRKALKLAPYLHEPYAGIARAEFKKGRTSKARNALRSAIENVSSDSTQRIYQAKLDMLKEFVSENSPAVNGG